jgi:acyl carrier protein
LENSEVSGPLILPSEIIMGLDSVELLVEVEEAFDTPVPDAAAAVMKTPGDLFDFLSGAGFKSVPVGPCLSQAVFNRLRRAIVTEFDVERIRVRPTANITKVIPQFLIGARRRDLLQRLDFRRPSPILTQGRWLRRDYGTFRDLAEGILARNYGVLAEEAGVWNPREAWNCLRRLIAWQLGVGIDKVTRGASLRNDLGMD